MKIIGSGMYLPHKEVKNKEIEKYLNLEQEYIEKRTGIKRRFFVENETIENMAYEASIVALKDAKIDKEKIDLIIVATTSTSLLMPGIANEVQRMLKIPDCICLDILAGCSGYINALDIAYLYISTNKAKNALVIGVEELSKYIDKQDKGTSILLADGAGSLIVSKDDEENFTSHICCTPDQNNCLSCKVEDKIRMQGTRIYKYAVTETVKNIEELKEITGFTWEDISYIIPHQSNQKILTGINNRLDLNPKKMYHNIEKIGNTFCASIPIAICEMRQKNLLQKGQNIILLGYGGGFNTGSVLWKI